MTTRPILEPAPLHHRRTVAVLQFLAVASILVPVLMLCAGGLVTWHDKRQEALDQTVRLGDLVYESTSKLFQAQLLATDQVRLMIGTMDDNELIANQRELHARLQAMLRYLPHLRTLFVVNRRGQAILDGDRYPAPVVNDLNRRDYFQHFHDGGTGLFVGSVGTRIVDRLAFFPLAVRRFSADGQFNGVIAASVNPSFFENFFRQVLSAYSHTENRTITLRRSDGQLLVQGHAKASDDAANNDAAAAEFLRSSGASGQLVADWSGENRLVAWRRLRDVDMVVFTSVSLSGIRHDWEAAMLPYLFFGLCAALALFSITVVALRRTALAEDAERRAMAESRRRQQAEDAARQSQKMEALGKLTGGVAHDFNNLLAVIQGSAELAKIRPADKVGRLLDNILHAAQRGSSLTRQLLSFSRSQALDPLVLDPHLEIPRMMELLRPSLPGNIQVDVRVADDLWLVELDAGECEIALLNIAVNARDAMPSGGSFIVTVSNQHISPGDIATATELQGDFIKVALRDTGSGIPPEVATRAFEPFFTTKDVGRSTGLGLSQVYGFARQAGGAATIEPDAAGGTTVTLYLPRTDKPIQPPVAAESTHETPDGSVRRILLVEDNKEVASITSEIIRTLGYEVVHVDRARKALDTLMAPDAPFHLLITDIVMPDGINGLQLAAMVRARLPGLPVILVSGYNDATVEQSSEFRLLRKPLPAEQLSQAIRSELGAYPRIVVDNTRTG